jgi:hypothetical protein
MTREEAIEFIAQSVKSDVDMAKVADAIKAIEQEPVLDKVRAEILEEMLSHSGTGEEVIQAYVDGLKKGLEIIDKYKTESEEGTADGKTSICRS